MSVPLGQMSPGSKYLTMSPEGMHAAWVDPGGGSERVLLDGKELWSAKPGKSVDCLRVGQKGKHWGVVQWDAEANRAIVIIDGATILGDANDVSLFAFAPSGEQWALWAGWPISSRVDCMLALYSNEEPKGKKGFVGKGAWFHGWGMLEALRVSWSDDGKVMAWIYPDLEGARVMLGTREIARYPRAWAIVSGTVIGDANITSRSKKGDEYISPETLTISPDGLHAAYFACEDDGSDDCLSNWWVYVDGQRKFGPFRTFWYGRYQSGPWLSRDATSIAWVTWDGENPQCTLHLSVQGTAPKTRSLGRVKGFSWSADGRHWAYVASPSGSSSSYRLFRDDSPVSAHSFPLVGPMAISPDGAHVAGALANSEQEWYVVIDGDVGPSYEVLGAGGWPPAWHKDGSHLYCAYVAASGSKVSMVKAAVAEEALKKLGTASVSPRTELPTDGNGTRIAHGRTQPQVLRRDHSQSAP